MSLLHATHIEELGCFEVNKMSFQEKIKQKAKTFVELEQLKHDSKIRQEEWHGKFDYKQWVLLWDVLAIYAEEEVIWNGKIDAVLLTLKAYKRIAEERKQKLQQFYDNSRGNILTDNKLGYHVSKERKELLKIVEELLEK